MTELTQITVITGCAASIAYGIAAIVRETYRGRALLVRAIRGDPEPQVVNPLQIVFPPRTAE